MLALSQKSSSGNNGHFSNSLLFENYFAEKSSLIYNDYKVQLRVTFQISLNIKISMNRLCMRPFFLVCITLQLSL